MRGYVGTTDFDWYTFLLARQPLEEVNFWQPSAHGFNAPSGTPFFFKLKSPHNAIAGFGVFARYEPATTQLAWDAFGESNGAASFEEMQRRVSSYANVKGRDHRVGCIMVSEPVFFPKAEWIAQPNDWKPNVVSGAGYDLTQGEGLRIWDECRHRASGEATSWMLAEPVQKFGAPQLVEPRLGQGSFRVSVTAAYKGACAVTGEHSLPVLDAAHIRPFADDVSTHAVSNGLLLRADIHRLFDAGYVTVTPDYRFKVSKRLKLEWNNGKAYFRLKDRQLLVPDGAGDQPDREALRWHNEQRFKKDAA